MISHVMTLANGIIGVSILAMPFCFKQCGIILATLLLLLSSVLSRLACHFLIKSAVMSRRRNFEFLAYHAFGPMGKVLAELCIIGYLLGTCTAFFVVVGDLGPQIIGELIEKDPEDIRTSLLITTGLFIVLPLGLLRNIDSLASVSTASIGFYICLAFKAMTESIHHIVAADWFDKVYFWRTSGILQCLPIFALALFCQPQLFEIYETLPNATLDKMNEVVKGALNICTIVYISVGIFGYIAFCTQPFSGNILMSFEPSLTSEIIKIGFVLSVAFSFPLVIFPCRASLNSLLYKQGYTHEVSTSYISENRFRCLTIMIVTIALIVGVSIPNIEFVLGIIGSTIGVVICLIFPAAFFISISTKNTSERLIAQFIIIVGIWTLVLGTYANLYALEQSSNSVLPIATARPLSQINKIPIALIEEQIHDKTNEIKVSDESLQVAVEKKTNPKIFDEALDNARQEPPVPVDRNLESKLPEEKKDPAVVENAVSKKSVLKQEEDKISDVNMKLIQEGHKGYQSLKKIQYHIESSPKKDHLPQEREKVEINIPAKIDVIAVDAIKKEESELAANKETSDIDPLQRREQLQKTLEEHIMQQKDLMKEQKELLKDIEEKKKELELAEQRIMPQDEKESDIKQKVDKSKNYIGLKIPASADDTVDKMNNEVPVDRVAKNLDVDRKNMDDVHSVDKKQKPVLQIVEDEELKNEASDNQLKRDPVNKSKIDNDIRNISLINVLSKQSDNNGHNILDKIPKENEPPSINQANGDANFNKNSSFSIPIALQMNQAPGLRDMLKSNNGAAVVQKEVHPRVKRMVDFAKKDSLNESEFENTEKYRNDVVSERNMINGSCIGKNNVPSQSVMGELEQLHEMNGNHLIKTSAHLTNQLVDDKASPKFDLPQKESLVKLSNKYDEILKLGNKKKK
ncbi:hypothetical protein QAD02_008718 [Eretmocerus hayati]|uniref:Uncharacterized protein n=1 Tax=Eretmocerus hayati TaxID=131215 RepID=A0ACC2N7J5_9HYME|nr:hypothetical protein QAD02_008718 [Eretmocerus hayati]